MNDAAPQDLSTESLVAQVADEFLDRLNRGEQPDVEDYARRYPHLARIIRQMLPALQVMRLPPETPDLAGAEHPCGRLGDYHIRGEIGRGGMGVVYEAEQISLGRRVALKVLPLAAALDAKQLQRFKNEAQAAAHLHHTNIVPVYAVGCERGVHYYAMQFIEGQSLAAMIHDLRRLEGRDPDQPQTGHEPDSVGPACRAGPVPPGRRDLPAGPVPPGSRDLPAGPEDTGPYVPTAPASLVETKPPPAGSSSTEHSQRDRAYYRTVANLGVQAAEALDHAHQLGVIHRDIKPANLLLDGRGNLWVTDFGLARFLDNPGLTLSGDLVGTIRYMSPEQALARRVLIDHRSDIYSLGVTLYELLTLEPAFAGRDRHEVLRQIAFEEPRSPRCWNRGVPAELETIVLKAMAKNPAERYATAGELADDLRRFLEDRPIHARRPTLRQRAAKWARRHRTLVAAAAVMLILAVAGLGVSTWLIWQEKEQTLAEKARTEQEKQHTERAYRAESKQRHRAQANLSLALDALDAIYLQVAESRLPRNPQGAKEDEALLKRGLKFYEDFIKQNGDESAVRYETGRAYLRVGDIRHRLMQPDGARAAYQRAIELFRQVSAALPNNPAPRYLLAEAHDRLGVTLKEIDRLTEAGQAFRQALNLLQKLTAEFPNNPDYLLALAGSHTNRGHLWWFKRGRVKDAEKEYRLALDLQKKVPAEVRKDAFYRFNLAQTHLNLAVLFRQTDRLSAAVKAYRQALDLLHQLVREAPQVVVFREKLALAHYNRGFLLEQLGRHSQAERAFLLARDLRGQLVAMFPGVPAYRQGLAASLESLANLRRKKGGSPEIEPDLRQALAIQQQLMKDYPKVTDYRSATASTLAVLGKELDRQGKTVAARRHLEEAIAHQKAALAVNPQNPNYRRRLNLHYVALADTLLGMAEQAGANAPAHQEKPRSLFKQALALLQLVLQSDSTDPGIRQAMAWAQGRIAIVQHKHGRNDKAETACRQALALVVALVKEHPQVVAYRADLATIYNNLGTVLDAVGRSEEAEKADRKAAAIVRQLTVQLPREQLYRKELAQSLNNLSIRLWTGRQYAASEKTKVEARAILTQLLKESPKTPKYRLLLAKTDIGLGLVRKALGRLPEAEQDYRRSCTILEELAHDFPQVPVYRNELALGHSNLGVLLEVTNRLKKAEEADRRAQKLWQELANAFPTRPDYQHDLAGSHLNLGSVLWKCKRLKDAEKEYEQALKLWQKLADAFPRAPDYPSSLGKTLHNWAVLVNGRNHFAQGSTFLKQAVTYQKRALQINAQHAGYRQLLHKHYFNLIRVLIQMGDHAQAARFALELPRVYPASREECRTACVFLSLCMTLAGRDTHLDEGQRQAAKEAYSRRMKALFLEGIRRTPQDLAFRNFMAWTLATAGEPLLRDANEAVRLAQTTVERKPQEGAYWKTLGVAHYRAGNWKNALRALEQSMKLRQGGDGYDWFFLAMTQWQLGAKHKARQWYDKAAAWMRAKPARAKNEELRRFQNEVKALLGN